MMQAVDFVHIVTDHHEKLGHFLYENWLLGNYCDLVIKHKGGEMKVHKLVVMSMSPTLTEISHRDDVHMLNMQDLDYQILEPLIKMVYTGILCVDLKLATKVAVAAKRFGMIDVSLAICDYIDDCLKNDSDDSELEMSDTDTVSDQDDEHEPVQTSNQSEVMDCELRSEDPSDKVNSVIDRSPVDSKRIFRSPVPNGHRKLLQQSEADLQSFVERSIKKEHEEDATSASVCGSSSSSREVDLVGDTLDDIASRYQPQPSVENTGICDDVLSTTQPVVSFKKGTHSSSSNIGDNFGHGLHDTVSEQSLPSPVVETNSAKEEFDLPMDVCDQSTGDEPSETDTLLHREYFTKTKKSTRVQIEMPSDKDEECLSHKGVSISGEIMFYPSDTGLRNVICFDNPLPQTHLKSSWQCEHCLLTFESEEVLKRHAKSAFHCPHCRQVYQRKTGLSRHFTTMHASNDHLKCRQCRSTSKTESEFAKHCQEEHANPFPFECDAPKCNFRAAKYYRLRAHAKIHSEKHEYSCEKCSASFSQLNGLASHRRSCYQLQEFLCDLCGQSFNHFQSLKLHRRTIHLGDRPFVCSVCGNGFTHHRNLKRHQLIHENSFPYVCDACGERFRHSNSFKEHAKKHSKDSVPVSSKIEQRNSHTSTTDAYPDIFNKVCQLEEVQEPSIV